jgi:hypothetical protein
LKPYYGWYVYNNTVNGESPRGPKQAMDGIFFVIPKPFTEKQMQFLIEKWAHKKRVLFGQKTVYNTKMK